MRNVQTSHGTLQVAATILVRDGDCKKISSFRDGYVASTVVHCD